MVYRSEDDPQPCNRLSPDSRSPTRLLSRMRRRIPTLWTLEGVPVVLKRSPSPLRVGTLLDTTQSPLTPTPLSLVSQTPRTDSERYSRSLGSCLQNRTRGTTVIERGGGLGSESLRPSGDWKQGVFSGLGTSVV